MNSWLEWKLALKNLFRNLRRTLSTGFALVVSFVGLSLLGGYVFKTENSIKGLVVYLQYLGHVSIYKIDGIDNFYSKPEKYQITGDELEAVREILTGYKQKIVLSGEFLSTPALLSSGGRTIPVLVNGVDPAVEEFARTHPVVKEWLPEFIENLKGPYFSDLTKTNSEVISVASGVAALLDRAEDPQNMSEKEKELLVAGRSLAGDFNAVNATLGLQHMTGVSELEDVSVRTSLGLLRNFLQTEGASHVTLFLKDEADVPKLVEDLQKEFKEGNLPLEAVPFRDERIGRYYNGIMSFIYTMVLFFFILILGASALIIVNSMTMGVLERSKEMGTLRALGFTPDRVQSLFVKEACWLTLMACGVGVIGSEIASALVNSQKWGMEVLGVSFLIRVRLHVYPWFYGVVTLIMVFIAVFCAYVVVKRKIKEKVANLLLESGASL